MLSSAWPVFLGVRRSHFPPPFGLFSLIRLAETEAESEGEDAGLSASPLMATERKGAVY